MGVLDYLLGLFVIIMMVSLRRRQTSVERELRDLKVHLANLQNSNLVVAKENIQDSISEPKEISEPEPQAEDEPSDTVLSEESDTTVWSKATNQGNETAEGESAAPANIAAQSSPSKNAIELEKIIGARWSVILGGIAVALGAIFMVRYSIEAGLLGPAARVTIGALLSAALFAGGEWLRRHDKDMNLPVFEKADIPSVLTGVGAIAAFATVYAAYALYGFIGPGFAFVALTIIGLATLALSSLHGPKLAAIGVLGAYAAPALVSTSEPNPVALAIHTLIVTGCVLALARVRQWLWLAIAGLVGGIGWAILLASINATLTPFVGSLMLVALALMIAIAFIWDDGLAIKPPEDTNLDIVAPIAFAAIGIAYFIHSVLSTSFPDIPTAIAISVVMMMVAFAAPELVLSAFAASFVIFIAAGVTNLGLQDLPGLMQGDFATKDLIPRNVNGYLISLAFIALPAIALGIFGSMKSALTAPRMAGFLATAATISIVTTILGSYLRISPFETKFLFGVIALVAAFVLAGLVEYLTKFRPDDMKAPAPAAYAVAGVVMVSFALGVSLSSAWMPFGFALTALGIAFICKTRPLWVLPFLAVGAAGLSAFALYMNSDFSSVNTTPLLNGLIILIGLPSLALLAAGEMLRREKSEPVASIVTTFGLAALGLFVSLQLRHWVNDGEIFGGRFDLADMSSQTIAALCFAIGLQRVAQKTKISIFSHVAMFAGALSAGMIAVGLFLFYNPYLNRSDVGTTFFFNMLLPAYLIPTILAGVVALMARPIRPRWYTLTYAFLGGLLLFTFVSLTNRHLFQGSNLHFFKQTSDLEFWLYSAIWLALGVGLLALGMFLKSLPIRAASGLLIALTIYKVFILDLSELTGFLRALSFLGLGGLLILIGRYYQMILGQLGEGDDGSTIAPPPDDSPAGEVASSVNKPTRKSRSKPKKSRWNP